jgi:glycosyltransferase involved in cell wall biosynthesis
MKAAPDINNAWEIADNAALANCPAPAVSVLISLYNYAAYITIALDSVHAAKTDGIPGGVEVLVLDDCSTDNSVAVVEKYMATSPLPIRLVKKLANSGLSDTRNIGLLLARAPLVFILDADNTIRPDCLLEHYRALAGSDHAMAFGIINRFDHDTGASVGTMSGHEWEVARLLAGPYIDAMAMVRKEAVLRVGGYSAESGKLIIGGKILPQGWEDYDLWLKLSQAGYSGKFIPQILSDYRVHNQSMLHSLMFFNDQISVYFTKKFLPLVHQHNSLPVLFGVPRRDLAVLCAAGKGLQFTAKKRPLRLIHRVLGKKLTRSLCKRIAELYCWLHP